MIKSISITLIAGFYIWCNQLFSFMKICQNVIIIVKANGNSFVVITFRRITKLEPKVFSDTSSGYYWLSAAVSVNVSEKYIFVTQNFSFILNHIHGIYCIAT